MEKKKLPYTKYELQEICDHINQKEVFAVKAERESIKFKQAEYMVDKVGEEFDGFIAGVTDFGLFCQIGETGCNGLCKVKDICEGKYVVDVENYRAIPSDDGDDTLDIHLGDAVRLKVVSSNIERKQISLKILRKIETKSPSISYR